MSDTTQSDVVQDSSPVVEEVVENPIVDEVETEGEQPKVEADKQEDEDDDSSLPNGVKKRIDKITRQKYEQQAEINKLKSELETFRAQTAPTLQEPDISKYDNLDSYVSAVVKYERELEKQTAQSRQAQQTQAQNVAQEWVAKVDKVRSVAPDFDAVFNNVASIEFAPMALEAVAQHPKGAEIAYMLGKDISEAYRIAALPPSQQLMAIGELAAKTNVPKPKAVSSAPAPIKPVQGGASNSSPPADIDEWMKWRNDQLRQKKR
jgi:Skp family chaperone for outer membrane proteins